MEQTYEPTIFGEEITVIYAGFWERFGALILDWLILLPITILNYFNGQYWKSVAVTAAIGVIGILYKPLLEYLYSATPGKKGLVLTIVNKDHQKINAREAVLRNIFGIIVGIAGLIITAYTLQHGGMKKAETPRSFGDFDTSMLLSLFFSLGVCLLYLADAICLVANPRKQSLHDLIAGTYVIKKIG